jgi:hypothetical protein
VIIILMRNMMHWLSIFSTTKALHLNQNIP